MITEQKLSVAEAARRLGHREPAPRREEGGPQEGCRGVPGIGAPDTGRRGTATTPGRRQAAGDGARHPQQSPDVLRHPDEVTFAGIEEHKTEWPIALVCRVLDVSRSGFYVWRSREPSAAEVRREELTEEVKEIRADVKARYVSPRAHAELVAKGHACSVNFVARIVRGRNRCKSHAQVPADDRPQPRAAGRTERPRPGFRPRAAEHARVCGHHVHPDPRGAAVPGGRRGPVTPRGPGRVDGSNDDQPAGGGRAGDGVGRSSPGLVAHSDRGSPYASQHDQRRLAEERITCRMSGSASAGIMRPWRASCVAQEGAGSRRGLRHPRGREGEHLRAHQGVLQPRPTALIARARCHRGVRANV
ncbi:hypothetical protein GobsT_69490 [Gemmata obscuriglobus]|nr:hypothetical protein GobsT_69490 [Gemmata obscuriglobus]VTS11451.1 Integrase catalytic region OS=Methylobacterium extorquens (strain CM4 / NCIMB 13688) GN=Mchl_1089 PE=4 SV=1 [Gemmata obscuriglobus UQM 2246]